MCQTGGEQDGRLGPILPCLEEDRPSGRAFSALADCPVAKKRAHAQVLCDAQSTGESVFKK
jgi:hypothetical protein